MENKNNGINKNAEGQAETKVEKDFKKRKNAKKRNCFINPRNDFAWYNHNQQLTNDSTGISFNNPIGRPLDLNGFDLNVPGIMSLTLCYGPGVSYSQFSAVNTAALRVYANTRRKNSGAKVYDSPDEMMYIIAVDSLYTIYSWMVRLYGTMSQYSATNRFMPRALVQAMGADFDDFQGNLADYRYYLNTLPGKMVQMAIPGTMDYTKRHAWLFSNLYKDGQSEKSQIYMFNPDGYYTWEEQVEGPGYLKYNYFPQSGITFSSLTTLFDTMITKLLGSQDVGTICGDIIKAYEGNLVTVSQIPADYAVRPVFNMEVLSQIQNATIAGGAVLNGDIKQNTDIGTPTIIWQPEIFHPSNVSSWIGKDRILTIPKDNPTAQDIVEATRLTVSAEKKGATASRIVSCMTEFVTTAAIYNYVPKLNSQTHAVEYELQTEGLNNFVMFDPTQAAALEDFMDDVTLWSYFDWAPAYYYSTVEGEGKAEALKRPLFEVNNYTSVDSRVLEKLHNTCRLSLFDIPMDGKLD